MSVLKVLTGSLRVLAGSKEPGLYAWIAPYPRFDQRMPRATRIWLLAQGLLRRPPRRRHLSNLSERGDRLLGSPEGQPHPCRDSRHHMIIASDVACPIADRFADTGDCHCVVSLIGAQVAINGIVRLCFGPLDALFPGLHQGRPLRAVSCSMVPTRSLLPGRRSCPREGSGRRRPG
jgi:hypothetical protein